jgi:hypothetical protein
MPDRILRLQQGLAPPEIEDRSVEDDKKFTPKFMRTRLVAVRDFGINKKQVTRTDGHRRIAPPFHPAAAVEQVDHGVLAERAHLIERDAPAVALIASQRDLSQRCLDGRVIGDARPLDHVRHAKSYMFFPTPSIGSDAAA